MSKAPLLYLLLMANEVLAQDTTLYLNKQKLTLPEVVVKNNLNYHKLLQQIVEDTTFYKAFRNLRIVEFTAFNDIKMLDKSGSVTASLYSKTKQIRNNNCRSMQVLEENTTGNFYDANHQFNYLTPSLYANLFFTNLPVCNENNIVKGHQFSAKEKKGMEKHKEQLKMLFFNPGKKIQGIPLIGDKLDLYDESAKNVYQYKLDIQERNSSLYYVFNIIPKDDLTIFQKDRIVIDEMTTWFDIKTMEVMYRSYALSYKAGIYDFDVSMEVEMTKINNLIVPKILRYKGNWDVIFKKRETAVFTATLFDFSLE